VCGESCVNFHMYELFTWLLWINSSLNPYLYAYSNIRIRKHFKRYLFSCGPPQPVFKRRVYAVSKRHANLGAPESRGLESTSFARIWNFLPTIYAQSYIVCCARMLDIFIVVLLGITLSCENGCINFIYCTLNKRMSNLYQVNICVFTLTLILCQWIKVSLFHASPRPPFTYAK
jgi:hypothetical protein